MKLYRLFYLLVTVVALVSPAVRAQTFGVLWSGRLGTGSLAWLSGDMGGDGRTDIIHPWNNNGTFYDFS